MKIFVAGGKTGFLGINIANGLEQAGHIVTRSCRQEWDLSIFSVDLSGFDAVFNCAAHTSGAKEMVENPVAQITENVLINMNLLASAAESGVKRYVFMSSSAIYPDLDYRQTEDEAFLRDPPAVYFGPAWMKRFSEKLLEFYHRQYGMQGLVIRPSNVYGPHSYFGLERAHVIPALIHKFLEGKEEVEVWGSPSVLRDFIYVDDFVKGVLLAFNKMNGYNVYNIASGYQSSMAEVVKHIAELTEFYGKIVYNDKKPMTILKRSIDNTKALRELGFQADTPLREGLWNTINWYKSQNV